MTDAGVPADSAAPPRRTHHGQGRARGGGRSASPPARTGCGTRPACSARPEWPSPRPRRRPARLRVASPPRRAWRCAGQRRVPGADRLPLRLRTGQLRALGFGTRGPTRRAACPLSRRDARRGAFSLLPVFPTTARRHGCSWGPYGNLGLTLIFNALGFPAAAVPLGLSRATACRCRRRSSRGPVRTRVALDVASVLEREFGGWRMATPGVRKTRMHYPCYGKDMAKVTSKLQVTVPKALAVQLGIRPGDEVDWSMSGDGLRVTPSKHRRRFLDLETRLRLFNEATESPTPSRAGWPG